LTQDVKISIRKLAAVTILSTSLLSWFYLTWTYFSEIFQGLGSSLFWLYVGQAVFFVSVAFSAITGSVMSEKISRRKFLWSWTAFGVLVTALAPFFQGLLFSLFFAALLGVSFGLGFPSCVSFLADSTVIEERARVSGIFILAVFIVLSLAIAVISRLSLGIVEIILLCIALRSTGFLSLVLDCCEREKGKEKSWRTILGYKDFLFYLFPWLMFSTANGLASIVGSGLPQSPDYAAAFATGNTLHWMGTGIFAFISGVLADRFGRKQPIIIGLVLLGISYAFLGIATSPLSWLVQLTTSGIAWGMLTVVYIAIPGDLAFPGSKERFYALGTIIPFIMYVSFSGISTLPGITIPVSALSSILTIVLFASVIPVLRASETLPESKVRARKVKEHIEKVGKLVQESKKPE
jgi:MFS family permease